MKFFRIRKSSWLLIVLIAGTFFTGLIAPGIVALTLMSFLTFVTGIYVLLKYFNRHRENKMMRYLQLVFRVCLAGMGGVIILVLILITVPQFSCQTMGSDVQEARYMIVLGAGLHQGDQLSYSLRTRLNKALEVFQSNPDLTVIASGGQGSDELLSEAQAMKNHLMERGVPEAQIILEDQSRSTYQNLAFSKQKMRDKESDQKIIVVTSDFHVFRAKFLAKSMGLDPIGICSPVYRSLKLTFMIREIPAVVHDFLRNPLR